MANSNVNYEDERFAQVETDKQAALSEIEQAYGGMISESDKYYQAQIDASKEWADKQAQLQQDQADFAIEQIEQQKAQAQKDYTKEQSGAYVDWQKQSNQYGTNAEQMAANGMTGTGYAESSQVAMYNTYQNRVATARESYQKAVLNYDNAIKDAMLQNNASLAEIAYQALQAQLELSLEGFQYKNNLILDQANKKLEVDNTYYARYQDVLSQINTENAMAEEIRQYNLNYDLQNRELEEQIRQFNEELARLKENDAKEYELQQAEIQKQQSAELAKQTLGSGTVGAVGGIIGSGMFDSSTLAVDEESIQNLGFGQISAETLESYVEQGIVEEYVEGNELKFKRTIPGGRTNAFTTTAKR